MLLNILYMEIWGTSLVSGQWLLQSILGSTDLMTGTTSIALLTFTRITGMSLFGWKQSFSC
jgi:hypothetical protein